MSKARPTSHALRFTWRVFQSLRLKRSLFSTKLRQYPNSNHTETETSYENYQFYNYTSGRWLQVFIDLPAY